MESQSPLNFTKIAEQSKQISSGTVERDQIEEITLRNMPMGRNEHDRKGNLFGPLFLRTVVYDCENGNKMVEVIPITTAHVFRMYFEGKNKFRVIDGVSYIPEPSEQEKYARKYASGDVPNMPSRMIVDAAVITVESYNAAFLG